MAMTLNIGSMKLNKWQVALLLGTPLAIGLGTYAVKRWTAAPSDKAKDVDAEENKRAKGKIEQQGISLDGTAPDKELERKKSQPSWARSCRR